MVALTGLERNAAVDTIRFKCGACQASLKVKAELAGTNGKCPRCGQPVVVPISVDPVVVSSLMYQGGRLFSVLLSRASLLAAAVLAITVGLIGWSSRSGKDPVDAPSSRSTQQFETLGTVKSRMEACGMWQRDSYSSRSVLLGRPLEKTVFVADGHEPDYSIDVYSDDGGQVHAVVVELKGSHHIRMQMDPRHRSDKILEVMGFNAILVKATRSVFGVDIDLARKGATCQLTSAELSAARAVAGNDNGTVRVTQGVQSGLFIRLTTYGSAGQRPGTIENVVIETALILDESWNGANPGTF